MMTTELTLVVFEFMHGMLLLKLTLEGEMTLMERLLVITLDLQLPSQTIYIVAVGAYDNDGNGTNSNHVRIFSDGTLPVSYI